MAGSPSPWADLLPDLVGLVLRRLPTLTDRVRLRAACRAWRREPLPVPFPWLGLPSGTFLSVPDGAVHRFPALLGPDRDFVTCRGSAGSWLFLTYWNVCVLANPFDGAVLRLPDVTTDVLDFKLVQLAVAAAPPADSLFALLTPGASEISIRRPWPVPATTIRMLPQSELLYDAAFLDGKLYAISNNGQLYIFDIDATASCDEGKPGVPPRRCIANNLVDTCQWTTPHNVTTGNERFVCKDWSYLVESGGRLLHVRRQMGYPPIGNGMKHARTLSFDVFEADLSARLDPWRRITALGGGQALFVGRYSKSVTASECGAREDCIYFVREHCRESSAAQDPLGDSGVFDMRNGRITPLLLETVAARPLVFQMEVV